MRTGIIEEKILKKAVKVFERTIGLDVEFYNLMELENHDAFIDIELNDKKLHFSAEIKNTFTHAMIGPVVQDRKKNNNKTIIITNYITPQIADKLKGLNVPFMDTAGNAYIKERNLYIFIKGNRLETIPKNRLQTRAFKPTGLQAIYALLCNPGLEDANYREIAVTAGVALGTVGWVMQDLKSAGFIVDMGRRGRRLIQKEKLLVKWVTAYAEQLRPKKIIGRYNAADPDFWKHKDLPLDKAFWGGEVAATKLCEYLKPEVVTIYTIEEKALYEYMVESRFKKDTNGNVEILQTFWDENKEKPYNNLVHPLLIYADLLVTANPRNIETAEIIYEKELAELIRED